MSRGPNPNFGDELPEGHYWVSGGMRHGHTVFVGFLDRPSVFHEIYRQLENPNDPSSREIARYDLTLEWNDELDMYEEVPQKRRAYNLETSEWSKVFKDEEES